MLYSGNKLWLNMGNVHRMGNFSTCPFHALAVESVSDEPVDEVHVLRSRLLFDFLIFALNRDLAINVSTVFAKLPIAIAISRIPQTTTCDTIYSHIGYNRDKT